jgi:hypothetical protein
MKKLNKFELLTPEDQQLVLRACAENPYHIAIQLLARPRSEGGLSLRTSRSALQRFYVHHHPDQRSLELVGQFADAIRIKGQAHLTAGFEAALVLVQTRILEALRNGRAVSDLEREFRSLERLQRCARAEEKRREGRGRYVRANYQAHVSELASIPEADFIRNEFKRDPQADGLTPNDLDSSSDLERDIEEARHDAAASAPPRRPRNKPLDPVDQQLLELSRAAGLFENP